MLVRLGERRPSMGLVDLLLECHERIRHFTREAIELATAVTPSLHETAESAGRIRRYFVEAFPLHVADEDELIAPRLAGTNAELDRALAGISADHTSHQKDVARLIAICTELEANPSRLARRSMDLGDTGRRLWASFEPHLAIEERSIFPAIHLLQEDERESIRREMRERRAHILR